MRHRFGRLLPEYRPAMSPTFVGYLHSNSHEKVLQIRKAPSLPNNLHKTVDTFEDNSAQQLKTFSERENGLYCGRMIDAANGKLGSKVSEQTTAWEVMNINNGAVSFTLFL